MRRPVLALLLTTYYLLLTTYYLLTIYYLPLTTYHLPLTTCYLLLTTYYRRDRASFLVWHLGIGCVVVGEHSVLAAG